MHLNFLLPQPTTWQLGDLNITPIVADFSVRQPIAELTTPLIWQGDMTLSQRLGVPFPESLHELENPTRWERGQHPLTVHFWGAKFATLRIAEYFYDEDTYTSKVSLTDILGLLDYRSPPAECEGIKVGNKNTWQSVVKLLLIQGGKIEDVTYIAESDILFDSNLPDGYYESPIIKTGSYIKTAQEIAGAHGCWLWVDRDEKIRITPYPVNSPNPLAVLNRAQIDLYQRQPAPEGPFNKVIVTGTKEAIANCPKGDPPTLETYGVYDGQKVLLSRETRSVREAGVNKIIYIVHKDQAKGDLFPDEHPGSLTLITAEHSVETHYFDDEGRATKIVSTKDIPKGVALPDIPKFKGKTALLTDAEKVEEEFFYGDGKNSITAYVPGSPTPTTPKDDGACTRKVKTTWGRFPITVDAANDFFDDASYSGLIIREEVEERWTQKPSTPDPEKPPCLRWRYTRITKRRVIEEKSTSITKDGETQTTTRKGPGALSVVQSEASEDSTPSGGPTREPDVPLGTVALKGEATLAPTNYQTFAPRISEVNVNWLTSNANAQRLAELLAKLLWQRRFSRFISHPLYQWFCEGWRPFIRLDVHQGSWIVDGVAIACAGGEGEFSWIGNFLGAIPEVPIPPEPPSWIPQPEVDPATGIPVRDGAGAYTYPLQVGPLPSLQLVANISIVPIRIPVVGGTGSYTYTLAGLPAGLSIVSGFIAGTPTATGIFSGQVEIDDGASSVIAPLSAAVSAAASPASPVALSLAVSDLSRVRQSNFRIEDSFLTPDLALVASRERVSYFELNPIVMEGQRVKTSNFASVEPELISAFIPGPPPRTIEYYLVDGQMLDPQTVGGGIDGSAYGSPIGLTAPDYVGQQYFDGVNTWAATGLTDQDWQQMTK